MKINTLKAAVACLTSWMTGTLVLLVLSSQIISAQSVDIGMAQTPDKKNSIDIVLTGTGTTQNMLINEIVFTLRYRTAAAPPVFTYHHLSTTRSTTVNGAYTYERISLTVGGLFTESATKDTFLSIGFTATDPYCNSQFQIMDASDVYTTLINGEFLVKVNLAGDDVTGFILNNTLTDISNTDFATFPTVKDVYCTAPYGSGDIKIVGGTAPYVIQVWFQGSLQNQFTFATPGTHTITGLTATTGSRQYNVKFYDDGSHAGQGCYEDTTFTIFPQFSATVSKQDAKCNGYSDGSATANPVGGAGTYTYIWDDDPFDPSRTQSISGLTAKTYTVYVNDALNCQVSAAATVGQPLPVTVTIPTSQNVKCFGGTTGSASASAAGGNGTYSYSWNNGQSSPTAINLKANTLYSVTARDGNNCTSASPAEITLTEPPKLEITNVAVTNITNCVPGTDGAMTITATGGAGSLQYSRDNVNYNFSNSLIDLAKGTYTAYVKDANNCVTSQPNVVINIDNPVVVDSVIAVPVTCSQGTDGQIKIYVKGGETPYSYEISPALGQQNDNIFSELESHNYQVEITDNRGCIEYRTASVSQPSDILMQVTPTAVTSCFGDPTGKIVISATQGNGNFTFSINGTDYQTSGTFNNVYGGNYIAYAKDKKGCTKTLNTTVSQPDSIGISLAITQPSCGGNADGKINATVSGGTGPYTYAWSNGQLSPLCDKLAPGDYSLVVTDKRSCKADTTVTLEGAPALQVSFDVEQIKCFGERDGRISAIIQGGSGDYKHVWNTGQITATIDRLVPGLYTVTVDDRNFNCTAIASVAITEPGYLKVSSTVTHVSFFGLHDGAIDIRVSGGTPVDTLLGQPRYYYNWNNGSTEEDLTNIPEGDYKVVVTDANNCLAADSVKVLVGDTEVEVPNAFTPNGDGVNDYWIVQSILKYPNSQLMIFDSNGKKVYEDKGEIEPWDGLDSNGTPLPGKNVYYYVLKLKVLSDEVEIEGTTITGSILLIR